MRPHTTPLDRAAGTLGWGGASGAGWGVGGWGGGREGGHISTSCAVWGLESPMFCQLSRHGTTGQTVAKSILCIQCPLGLTDHPGANCAGLAADIRRDGVCPGLPYSKVFGITYYLMVLVRTDVTTCSAPLPHCQGPYYRQTTAARSGVAAQSVAGGDGFKSAEVRPSPAAQCMSLCRTNCRLNRSTT